MNMRRHTSRLRGGALRFTVLGALLSVAACSSATDGNTPSTDEPQLAELNQALEAAQSPPSAGKKFPRASHTKTAQGKRTVWVVMKQRANVSAAVSKAKTWKAKGDAVVNSLSSTARTSQASLVQSLTARKIEHKPFWIANTVKVVADDATIAEIAARSDVAKIVEDKVAQIPDPKPGHAEAVIGAIEWNIESTRAPEVWNNFATRGEGIVVANIDTGVQFDHPALANQYRGNSAGSLDHNYNWFDPTGICGDVPCDNAGHGTHTMGTIVGDDGGENQIGVAPGAKWIAAKGCEDFGCSFEALLSSGQWVLAPTDQSGANPRPDLRPNVVSNSWGGGSGDEFYRDIVNAWVSAGIFPVFANGNAGPFCGSVSSPGDYPESYGVGAYDINNIIADFSGRGSSAFGVIKPNISAPGVNVRSAFPGSGYDWMSGTSMATPHVTGAIALLWSAAPAMVGDIALTRELLGAGAIDVEDDSCGGDPGNNNVWGEGRMDIVASLEMAPIGPTGWLSGLVASENGESIGGARVSVAGPINRTLTTGVDGTFNVRLPVGAYEATANAFAYLPQTLTGVQINEGETTSANFSLATAPSFAVSGVVSDASGAPLAGATVSIPGTPLPAVTTDANGYYSFPSVPVGEYQLSVKAGGCYASSVLTLVVDSNEDVPVTLAQKSDSFGYVCSNVPFEYISGTTQLPLFGDDAQTQVTLPFPFPMYGSSFTDLQVTTNGYVAFDSLFPTYWNTPIPSAETPNAAVYGMWDDLYVDYDSGIYTTVVGEAPNRKFVVEWRNVAFLANFMERTNFEIILSENGEITVQHQAPTTGPLSQGSDATLGLEDPAGEVGIQYSYAESIISGETAVKYSVPFAGFVQGTVLDANDGLPVAGAVVVATADDGSQRQVKSAKTGGYRLMITRGHYVLAASRTNYQTETQAIDVTEGETTIADFTLATAKGVMTPSTVQLLLPQNVQRSRTLTLSNEGGVAMPYAVNESGGRRQSLTVSRLRERKTAVDLNAKNARDAFEPISPAAVSAITPAAAGDVLASFPSPVGFAWGIGQSSNLWLNDINTLTNFETTTTGQLTGVSFTTPWAGEWAADMGYDYSRGTMCQLAVGADNGIHCWDTTNGLEVATITGSPWSSISQRGLAYKASDDTFYVGGWNEGIIYHVAGLSHATPGTVISSCIPSDWAISGLAYNEAMDVLWMATNSETDTIYELNPEDCTVLSTLAPPQGGAYQGAGLEMDPEGNLWVISQSPNTVYLVDSGVPAFSDVSWLSISPTEGEVAAGSSTSLNVTVDTTGLQPGLYLASVFVRTNSGREPTLRVPVSVVVTDYLQAVNSGGNAYTDTSGDGWVKDQAHTQGSWGYVQKGKVNKTNHAIGGTTDPSLYQDLRENPYGYRFDNVPNGVYQVEFRFAELDKVRLGQRLFDAIIEDTVVLPAHDIQYEVGRYTAEARTFFVEVTDGRLDVRLLARSGSKPAVINALRVTHRVDR